MKTPVNAFAGLDESFDEVAQVPAASNESAEGDGASSRIGAPQLKSIADHIECSSTFDYRDFSPAERKFLRRSEIEIKRTMKTSVLVVGRRLLEVRDRIRCRGDQTWSDWLTYAIDISKSSAHNYMAAAAWVDQCPTVGQMPLQILYMAATASAPVKEEIASMIEAGKDVSIEVVQALKHADKPKGSDPGEGPNPADAAPKNVADVHPPMLHEHTAASKLPEIEAGQAIRQTSDPAAAQAIVDEADTTVKSRLGKGDPGLEEVGREERAAAVELVARLREAFGDDAIIELLALLHRTTFAALSEALSESA